MRKPLLTILLTAFVSATCSMAFAQETQKPATLRYKVPAGWLEEQRSSSMRVAQYKLPRAEGDTEDASLVLYYFGKGQGGRLPRTSNDGPARCNRQTARKPKSLRKASPRTG